MNRAMKLPGSETACNFLAVSLKEIFRETPVRWQRVLSLWVNG